MVGKWNNTEELYRIKNKSVFELLEFSWGSKQWCLAGNANRKLERVFHNFKFFDNLNIEIKTHAHTYEHIYPQHTHAHNNTHIYDYSYVG